MPRCFVDAHAHEMRLRHRAQPTLRQMRQLRLRSLAPEAQLQHLPNLVKTTHLAADCHESQLKKNAPKGAGEKQTCSAFAPTPSGGFLAFVTSSHRRQAA
jgi:hypothetical protein